MCSFYFIVCVLKTASEKCELGLLLNYTSGTLDPRCANSQLFRCVLLRVKGDGFWVVFILSWLIGLWERTQLLSGVHRYNTLPSTALQFAILLVGAIDYRRSVDCMSNVRTPRLLSPPFLPPILWPIKTMIYVQCCRCIVNNIRGEFYVYSLSLPGGQLTCVIRISIDLGRLCRA